MPRLTRGTARTCLDLLNGRPAGPALAARFRCHGRLGVGGVLVFLPDASLAAALETR